MKTTLRKLLPAFATTGLLLALPLLSSAQFIFNDPLHMSAQIVEFGQEVERWRSAINNFQVIRDAKAIVGVTKDITG